MAEFNIAFLEKQGCGLLIDPNSLVAKVFKAKYFPKNDFLNSRLGNKSSYAWRIAELINNFERDWNREMIVNTFPEAEAELILRIPLAIEPHVDFLAWNGDPSGEYLVRSAYKLLQSSNPRAYALQTFLNLKFDLWLTKVFALPPPKQCRIFCGTLWAIWGDKNARIHDKTNRSGQEIGSYVHSYLNELDGFGKNILNASKVVKINFDGAYDEKNH
ncbi:hypothetical protein J1N35_027370 [Gossypium stocksii]|uniref:Uncharacterized protein n=1 Tax=Gossypium stocksii TaxID=47602 RepID=A0A9D3V9S1_9ROSI|nr:hypothetical protein J1N35_027370 [Gossypium stocksii]